MYVNIFLCYTVFELHPLFSVQFFSYTENTARHINHFMHILDFNRRQKQTVEMVLGGMGVKFVFTFICGALNFNYPTAGEYFVSGLKRPSFVIEFHQSVLVACFATSFRCLAYNYKSILSLCLLSPT